MMRSKKSGLSQGANASSSRSWDFAIQTLFPCEAAVRRVVMRRRWIERRERGTCVGVRLKVAAQAMLQRRFELLERAVQIGGIRDAARLPRSPRGQRLDAHWIRTNAPKRFGPLKKVSFFSSKNSMYCCRLPSLSVRHHCTISPEMSFNA